MTAGARGSVMARRPKVQIIPPPQDLKRKAVNFRKGVALNLGPRELRRIETVIQSSGDRFAQEALARVRVLRHTIEDVRENADARPNFLSLVRRAARDLKGLGGTFGYPLLSAVARSLDGFVRARTQADDNQLLVIRLHLDTIYVVLLQRITGPAGEIETELIQALSIANKKYG